MTKFIEVFALSLIILCFGCFSQRAIFLEEELANKTEIDPIEGIEKQQDQSEGIEDFQLFECDGKVDSLFTYEINRIAVILYETGMKNCIMKNAATGSESCQEQLIKIIKLESKYNPTFLHNDFQYFRGNEVFNALLDSANRFDCMNSEHSPFTYHYLNLLGMIESINGDDPTNYIHNSLLKLFTREELDIIINDRTDCSKRSRKIIYQILKEAQGENKVRFKAYLSKED